MIKKNLFDISYDLCYKLELSLMESTHPLLPIPFSYIYLF